MHQKSYFLYQCTFSHTWPMYGYLCLASKKFEKNNIYIQGQKPKGCVLKYGKLVWLQNTVSLYLTQAYNAILEL